MLVFALAYASSESKAERVGHWFEKLIAKSLNMLNQRGGGINIRIRGSRERINKLTGRKLGIQMERNEGFLRERIASALSHPLIHLFILIEYGSRVLLNSRWS